MTKLLVLVALVLAAIVSVLLIRGDDVARSYEELYPDPAVRSEAKLEALRALLISRARRSGVIPSTMDEIFAQPARDNRPNDLRYDGWARLVNYEVLGDTAFALRSSGADTTFGTRDDIVLHWRR